MDAAAKGKVCFMQVSATKTVMEPTQIGRGNRCPTIDVIVVMVVNSQRGKSNQMIANLWLASP